MSLHWLLIPTYANLFFAPHVLCLSKTFFPLLTPLCIHPLGLVDWHVMMLCAAAEDGHQYEIWLHSGIYEPRWHPHEAQSVYPASLLHFLTISVSILSSVTLLLQYPLQQCCSNSSVGFLLRSSERIGLTCIIDQFFQHTNVRCVQRGVQGDDDDDKLTFGAWHCEPAWMMLVDKDVSCK